jgi:hypothetical protein
MNRRNSRKEAQEAQINRKLSFLCFLRLFAAKLLHRFSHLFAAKPAFIPQIAARIR